MPPTLGQRLKHAREKRGLTLRDVQHTTRIPVARLQDLEEDKLNTFGGMAYAKSFLKSYATMLDVNADEVLAQLQPPPLGGVGDYRYLVESQGPWIRYRSDGYSSAPMSSLGPGRPYLLIGMVCFFFALLIGGGVIASVLFSRPSSATSTTTAAATTPTPETILPPLQDEEEMEYIIHDVSVTVASDPSKPSTPPKAVPVLEPVTSSVPKPPKALPVR